MNWTGTLDTGMKAVEFVKVNQMSEFPSDNEMLSRQVHEAQARGDRTEHIMTHPIIQWGLPLIFGVLFTVGIVKWGRS